MRNNLFTTTLLFLTAIVINGLSQTWCVRAETVASEASAVIKQQLSSNELSFKQPLLMTQYARRSHNAQPVIATYLDLNLLNFGTKQFILQSIQVAVLKQRSLRLYLTQPNIQIEQFYYHLTYQSYFPHKFA
jgi:hypothetical protein